MVMVALGLPKSVPYASILRTTSIPLVTFPKTVCFPFNQGVAAVQMKTGEVKVMRINQRKVGRIKIRPRDATGATTEKNVTTSTRTYIDFH